MRRGRSLEKLVETLERALGAQSGAKIESPKRLVDSRTGKLREHDLVVTLSQGLHVALIAIECRDRSRPFGVPHLEAFRQKCLDTGVSRGVVVSPKGFRNTALVKAKAYGMECLDLTQADTFDWLGLSALPIVRQNLRHIELTIVIDTPGYEAVRDPSVLFRAAGADLTLDAFREHLTRYLNSTAPLFTEAGRVTVPFSLAIDELVIKVPSRGETHPVKRLQGKAHFDVERQDSPFKLVQYGHAGASSEKVEAAVAPIAVGPLQGELVILMQRDGGEILFMPKLAGKKGDA